MVTMSQTWSISAAVVVLLVSAMQICTGEKSCTIWSSAGKGPVQRGSSFRVYCTFNCKDKGLMYSYDPKTQQSHTTVNSTTIYSDVVNITEDLTYSCECTPHSKLDPCGMDISAGYPPERPKNISCIYKVTGNDSGVVLCTWSRGRDTFLKNSSVLWVRTVSGNHTSRPVSYKVSSKGTGKPSATFNMSRSIQLISVWVHIQNQLGSAASDTINYTLSDIAIPPTPVLVEAECSSRKCFIKVDQPVTTQHLEIQYKAGAQTWTSYLHSVEARSSVNIISPLEPYTLYHFRARSKFSNGNWSQWSANLSSWTEEEAPAKELDVWYAEPTSDFKSLRVYWKELDISMARGKIIQYKVRVSSPDSGLVFSTNTSADARNYLVPFCANCEVTVRACNSKGQSPPARITTLHKKAGPPQDVQVSANNLSVTISWRKPETAPPHAVFVVEWYPEGHKLEELSWVRLGRSDNHAVITDMKPYECYEGAVYVIYGSSVGRTRFTDVSTLESAPSAGPSVGENVEGNAVTVTWMDIPRGQRRGCITNYTIYLDNGSGQQQPYSVSASKRTEIIRDLSPAVYSLWMTASTAAGEGHASQKVKFIIQQETKLSLLLMCGVVSLITLFLLCLCHSSTVKQRFWVFFPCLMLDVVPDPANSKWAKECTQEKGKINLQLQLSNSSATEEEEEPDLVDIEELPNQSSDIDKPADISSQLPLLASLSPSTGPATLLYPVTTYIKSFSTDSDSSDHTQTSLDTNTTVDYISSHGMGILDEDEEEEEDEDFTEMSGFFPSHSIILEPLEFGGKLTLDAVKIDCNDLFQNS